MGVVLVTEKVNVPRSAVPEEHARERCATPEMKRRAPPARGQKRDDFVGDHAAIESLRHPGLRGGHSAGMSSSQPHILRLRPR